PINITATDNVGVTRIELYFNGTLVGTGASSPAVFSWNTTVYANGTYRLQARAYDAAGNVGTSVAVNVTVQNPAPITDMVAPTVRIARGAHTLQAYAYDAAGNVGASSSVIVYK